MQVRPKLSLLIGVVVLLIWGGSAAASQDMKPLSSALVAGIAAAQRKTVAVVDFTDLDGNATNLGRFLAEELSVALAGNARGFEVIDRAHLKSILQEHRLASSGLIDPQTARKLGQIAGVDTLVTGTITPLGDIVRLTVKALDTETARIICASSTDISRTKAIDDLLGRVANTPGSQGDESQNRPVNPIYETESYRATVESVRKVGQSITVSVVFESLSEKTIELNWGEFTFGHPTESGPYLLDENGDKWTVLENDAARIIWHAGFGTTSLPSGTKIRTKFLFGGTGTGKIFTLVCRELRPRNGREVVIHGLKLDASGARLEAPPQARFDVQLAGSTQLNKVAVSLVAKPDTTYLFIYWPSSSGNQVVKLNDISSVEVKHHSLEFYNPGTIVQFGIGGPPKPKVYELVVETRQDSRKKYAYHFVSDTAMCQQGNPCQEGTDGGQSVRDLASAIQEARNTAPRTR